MIRCEPQLATRNCEFIVICSVFIIKGLNMNNQTAKTDIGAAEKAEYPHKLSYVECSKSGMHFGEVCNMVCMEPSCLEDLICCCACIEESHKKHMAKPLKIILNEAKAQAQMTKPTNFNIDVILDIMSQSQKDTLEIFHNCKKEILSNLDEIQKSLVGYYNSISDQIKLKNSDPKSEVTLASQVISAATSLEEIKQWTKKLVAMIPSTKDKQVEDFSTISQNDLIDSLKTSNEGINKMISKDILAINNKLKEYQKSLEAEVNNTNIWKKSSRFVFSSTLKHSDIKLINEYHTKSANTSGYKFAVMEPGVEKGSQVKTFHFKIRECSSNWVAVGICHKEIVASKSYAFNFSNLGHGGYMISANGGTWSNTSADFNNKVKAFKFIKGDVISVVVDMTLKKVTFKKKSESFEIPFQTIPGDELHPCALYYYMNDQVEFLPSYKP